MLDFSRWYRGFGRIPSVRREVVDDLGEGVGVPAGGVGDPEAVEGEEDELSDEEELEEGSDDEEEETEDDEPEEEEEEDKEPEKKGEEKKEKKEKKEGEEEEEEEEEETDDEKKDKKKEDDEPVIGRPAIRDIKAKYPNFFKDFPEMRHVYFREKEFSDLFPSVEDAKDAAAKSDVYDDMAQALSEGQTDAFLKTLDDNDPPALKKLAETILPALWRGSKELYAVATEPLLVNFIRNVYARGQKAGGDEGKNMMNSAKYFAKVLTGEFKIPDAPKGPDPNDPERLAFEREKAEHRQNVAAEFSADVARTCARLLAKDIERGLDPEGAIPAFVKKALVKEIFEGVNQELKKDRQYMAKTHAIKNRAARAGFAGAFKTQLITTYLGRARQVLVPIRQKARQELLGKGKKGDVKKLKGKGEEKGQTGHQQLRRTEGAATGGRVDYKKKSDLDILNER